MARLSYETRKKMPEKEFALPGKRKGGKGGYPIEDKAHARDALARVAQHGSAAQKAEVREKVHAKFPGIGEGGGRHTEVNTDRGKFRFKHNRPHEKPGR